MHRLRDLNTPEHVFELHAPGLQAEFPALRSLDSHPNNLPARLTPLVGRDRELEEIEVLLGKSRLVTLAGAGGVGKTRLACQIGNAMLGAFDDGVWLVELATISDGGMVAQAIAAALGLSESGNGAMLEAVLDYLRDKNLLLLLDNCEHVVAGAARTAQSILQKCPGVTILATSRETLGIPGERAYRTPSLAVPSVENARGITAAQALAYGAVGLFVERAVSADGGFALTDGNAAVVCEICRRLDGIALAIELAAARVRVLSVNDLAQRLDERFRILSGGSRTALPRQQTMRATIDWSYDLLRSQERTFFRWLAVFADSFSLERVESVASDAGGEFDALDLLASLVEKSLVQIDPGTDETRYRLLESTEQYAREKLIENGELETASRAHARAYLSFAQQLEARLETLPDPAWLALAEPEWENWRAALAWSLASGSDVQTGQELVVALRAVWIRIARAALEGRRWVQAALDAVDARTPLELAGRLEMANVYVSAVVGPIDDVLQAAERALASFEQAGDALGVAEAQRFVGQALTRKGEHARGEAFLHAALTTFREHSKESLTGHALLALGTSRYMDGDVAGARPFFDEALTAFRGIGSERSVAMVAAHRAEAEFQGGDAEAAVRFTLEALAADRALREHLSIAIDLCNIAAYLVHLGRFGEARAYAREALDIAYERDFDVPVAWAIQHLAAAAVLETRQDGADTTAIRERAARLCGFTDAHLEALENEREHTERQERDALEEALGEALGVDTYAALVAEGRTWSDARAVSEAQQWREPT